jgi:RHS repeat-associated protein
VRTTNFTWRPERTTKEACYPERKNCTGTNPPTASYNALNQVTWTSVNAAVNGLTYDAAGNVYYDGLNTYAYDAEGRLCAVQLPSISGGTQYQYLYDASGVRVGQATFTGTFPAKNATCSAAGTAAGFALKKLWLTDLSGNQVTELNGTGGWVHSNVWAGAHLDATYDTKGLHFHLADPLGSRRVQTNALGAIEENIQSLPFGDGLSTVVPTGAPATADDATEHHFTGKERDTETGNDYFDARYYSSLAGRFLSPDWSAKVAPIPYAKLDDPQSLNLYTYVLNNPLVLADADGHSTDIYKPDLYNHGEPHIDRETKGGKLVGRYRPDGTPIEHKKNTPPPIPKADQGKFDKAAEKVRRRIESQQEYQDDVNNRPPVPRSPIPDGLKPDPMPFPAVGPCAGPCDGPGLLPFPNITPVPMPGPLPFPEPMPIPVFAAPPPGSPGTGHWEPTGNEVPRWVPNEHICPGNSKC